MTIQENDLLFAKVKENAIIPTKKDGDAGLDIFACFDCPYMIIPPHQTVMVPAGIASVMHPSKYIQIEERGSTGSKGIKKSAGVIDSSFRGEWFVPLSNVNDKTVIISKIENEIELFMLIVSDAIANNYELHLKDYMQNIISLYKSNKTKSLLVALDKYTIIYSYSKAIAQGVVHEVIPMDNKEISYEELLKFDSERGTNCLGSTNK